VLVVVVPPERVPADEVLSDGFDDRLRCRKEAPGTGLPDAGDSLVSVNRHVQPAVDRLVGLPAD